MNSSTPNRVSEGLLQELQPLWRYSMQLTRQQSDAEDLVQRTCLRALEQAEKYQPASRLRSWLFKICLNIWRNELRSRQVRDQKAFTVGPGAATVMDTDNVSDPTNGNPESHMILHEVHSAVESLPEAQRMVVLLVCVEGFSYRDAADVLDVPIGTVMSRLARARLSIGSSMRPSQNDSSSTVSQSQGTGLYVVPKGRGAKP